MGRIGIIRGSGLYKIEGLKKIAQVLGLPRPLAAIRKVLVTGELSGQEDVSNTWRRHDVMRGTAYRPAKINYRANNLCHREAWGYQIISVGACGSLKEELQAMDFVDVEQLWTGQTMPAR